MAIRGLDLVLMTADRTQKRVIASLRWPAEVDAEVRTFLRDNLLAERLGDARRAEVALKRGFVPAAERVAFLAERPFYLPEVSETLASAIDLEDLVAVFSTGLQALRMADPELDLVFEFIG